MHSETKVCVDCKLEKPFSAFKVYRPGTSTESSTYICRLCSYSRSRKTELSRIRIKCSRYCMTEQHYMQLEFDQDNRCALCNQKKPLEIDHCHKTGKVRGLLCVNCNMFLGMANDDIEILKKAIEYLCKE